MRTPELQQRIQNALTICNEFVRQETGQKKPRRASQQKRDLTQEQFEYRARKAGWEYTGHIIAGYWSLGNISVNIYNAGTRRRDWLKYLERQRRRLS